MNRLLLVNLNNLLLSLSEAVDVAKPSVVQHQQRTAYIALEIATKADLETEITKNIFTAALLHDIGAVTVEEKILLHSFNETDCDVHTIKGEILLEQIPWLKGIATIVRNHHKNWNDWEEGIENPVVLASQIILLADLVERLIDRDKYILHQSKNIVETVKKLEGTALNKKNLIILSRYLKEKNFGWN